MADILRQLISGWALSVASCSLLLGWMKDCRTGGKRLRSGFPPFGLWAIKLVTTGSTRPEMFALHGQDEKRPSSSAHLPVAANLMKSSFSKLFPTLRALWQRRYVLRSAAFNKKRKITCPSSMRG
ncbi:MAG: hypothetical protein ABF876_01625 [Acetobacter aceti]